MSEVILKTLMQLFALVVKQDSGVLGNERAYVERFLRQQLHEGNAAEYLEMFDRYSQDERKEEVTSVKDSVRVLQICRQINGTLTQKQKVVVLLRVFELVNVTSHFSDSRMLIISAIADVFNIPPQEYQSIKTFATGNTPAELDLKEILLIGNDLPLCSNAKTVNNCELEGILVVLHVFGMDLYFLRYIGAGFVYLNSTLLNNRSISLFASGSTIRIPRSKPLYYSDVVANFTASVTGKILFEARNISIVFPSGTVGLHHISLSENHGQLIGIMGASGSGKTTLLNVLCGMERPTDGEVFINGVNLHDHKHELEGIIGYIPQDDLLIEELTVFENLYYNARLCFRDKTRGELEHTVDRTLHALGLYDRKNLKVGSFMNKTISGGQRKRLNVALELLREPSILFVDEPTSGLSSRDSENVMDLMSELAQKGKQVFVVIHQPSSDIFKMFDKIIILDAGGYMIYYGNPVEAVMYFKRAGEKINSEVGECPSCGNVNPELIFNIVEEKVVNEFGNYTNERKISPMQWEERYRKNFAPVTAETVRERPPHMLNIPNWFTQFYIYLTRDFRTKISNRQYLLLTLLEAPALGLILAYVIRYIADPMSDVYIFRENENIPIFIFMSLIVALFLGLIVSAEEVFRDRKILKREAFLNLSKSGYLTAKIFLLAVISALQSFLFVIVANSILEIKEMYFIYWLAMFSTSVAANILGLIISSTFNSAVTIYIVIPLLMIPMMVLSGAMFSFDKLNRKVSGVDKVPLVAEFMITRWSYEALMVYQYKNNRFEKYFYDIEKKESSADFRQAYVVPELETCYHHCFFELSHSGKIETSENDLIVLRNEVAKELSLNPNAQFDISLLYPETFNTEAAHYLHEFIHSMNAYYMQQFSLANQEKEQLIAYMLQEDTRKYTYLKNTYYNEHLSEIVRKFYEKNKILLFNGTLVQQIDPIYADPVATAGWLNFRTHFFAPRKYFARRYFDTYWFNITIIWIFVCLFYLVLYFDGLKKLIRLPDYFKRKIARPTF
ncbi:MAG: ATP-binding cassette domain-containing protein [Bacteroidales bacterium]|jgi:ABC-type multidrug transport system ATPase subunit|nr:ATP-binding cassette domain-containing protein [Bacteroidales bacterium]